MHVHGVEDSDRVTHGSDDLVPRVLRTLTSTSRTVRVLGRDHPHSHHPRRDRRTVPGDVLDVERATDRHDPAPQCREGYVGPHAADPVVRDPHGGLSARAAPRHSVEMAPACFSRWQRPR